MSSDKDRNQQPTNPSETVKVDTTGSPETSPVQDDQREASSGPAKSMALPVLPLRNSVLFPSMMMPLAASRPVSVAAIENALGSEDKTLLVVSQLDPTVEHPSREDLCDDATIAVIKKAERNGDEVSLIAHGLERVKLIDFVEREPYITMTYREAPVANEATTEVEALRRQMIDLATKIAEQVEGNAPAAIVQVLAQVEDPLNLAYLLASLLGFDTEKDRKLLAANSYLEVLKLMHQYLSHELEVRRLQQEIASSTQSELTKQQREYYLRRQLEAIQEELGEDNPEKSDVAELRRQLEAVELPAEIRKAAEKEMARLERMSSSAADYQLTRAYLDLVLELPWTRRTEDNLDLKHAREILDADHFGLESVKDRIVEHLAVMKLNPNAKAPILCFVGPPGVGKTSLGKSIARSLGRKFERLALGGLHDESELRGHRRTYIGAMPGRVIQALRRAETGNPLIMLDEIDKLGRDFRGDPAAALMEILDPEQNREFHDNYLDLPYDLSKVLFITTANTLDSIPAPLLDRMEVLRLSGYSSEEKEHIARRYLIPRQTQEAGLTPEQLVLPDETLRYAIRRYTREAGVRGLERVLGRIARKVATQFVEQETTPASVSPDDLADILGPEKFTPEKARQQLRPGVAAGLAWTATGGDVLYIEAVELDQGGKLTLTGQLGQVMRESARAARSYLISAAPQLGIDKARISKASIHIHVPAGAVPKDGPSAGVTMASAMASLFTDLPIRTDTAMTGEITLSGLVMPVGGIKEKVLAAHRSGIRRVILPKENEKDLSELPDQVRDEMEFITAERIEEVLSAAIASPVSQRSDVSLV